MRFPVCLITTLLLIAGCDYLDDSDDMSDSDDMLSLVKGDAADCYQQTVVVDDYYAVVLDKNCMDSAILSANPRAASTEIEVIVPFDADPASTKTETEGAEAEVAPEYACPIEDLGDWALLVRLARNNFNLGSFRVPDEEIDLITQAFVDQKDFLFIIYEPAVIVDPRLNRGRDRAGGTLQTRYYLENPGLLNANALIPHFYTYHFIDPDARWFQHWDKVRDLTESGFTISFDTRPMLEPEEVINPRKFEWGPQFGTSLDGFTVDGAGAPDIKEDFLLDIYIR